MTDQELAEVLAYRASMKQQMHDLKGHYAASNPRALAAA